METIQENIYHITWVTHNSRVSERMKWHNVKTGTPVIFTNDEEAEIAGYIAEVTIKDKIKVLAFNLCREHVHLLLKCQEAKRDSIINKLKAVSSRRYNIAHGITKSQKQSGISVNLEKGRGETQNKLWAQKYNWSLILDEEALTNVYNYVKYNRLKHQLSENRPLEKIIEKITASIDEL